MAILFPALPTNGQTYTTAGTTYTYDASKTLWRSDSSVLDWVVPQTPIVIDPANYTNTTYTSAQLLTSIKTVDGPASGLNADLLDGKHASAFASVQDTSLLYLYAAENKGNRLNMVGGIMDPFSNQTDVDTVASAASFYGASFSGAQIGNGLNLIPVMTSPTNGAITISESSSLVSTYVGWKAADGLTTTRWITNNVTNGWLQVDFGIATSITNYALTPNASYLNAPYDFELLGSNDGTHWVTLGSESGIVFVASVSQTFISAPASMRYYRLNVLSINPALTNYIQLRQLELFGSLAIAAMTLQSTAFTASAVPTTCRLGVQATGTFTINTDLTAEVSRDGGTTWATATLVLIDTLADGTKYYEDAAVSVATQPSGTAMKYRIKTLTGTVATVSGVLLQWS